MEHLYPESFYWKISDTPRAEGLRFTVKKKFDIIMINNNIPYALETKVHTHGNTLPIDQRMRDQVENLKEFKRACNNTDHAYLLINIKCNKQNYAIWYYPEEVTADMKSLRVYENERRMNRVKINGKTVWNMGVLI